MQVSRRAFLKWVGLGSAATVVSACAAPTATPVPPTQVSAKPTDAAAKPTTAQAQPTAVPATKAPAKPVKLTFTTWGDLTPHFKEQIELYKKVAPHVTIDLLEVVEGYDQKILTMMAGGTPPDVALTLRFTFFNFLAKKVIVNMQPYLDKLGWKREDYFDAAIRPHTYKGSVYALPNEVSCKVVFYNKKLFDDAGVPYPAAGWTWNDMVEKAKKLTKRDAQGKPLNFGFLDNGIFGGRIVCFPHQNGGSVVDDVTMPTKFTMHEPAGAEAMQFLADLALVHKVSPTPADKAALGGAGAMDFKAGNLAMHYSEFPLTSEYRKNPLKFDWDIAEPPMQKKKATWVGGSCMTVPTSTPNRDEAMAFTAWMCGAEASKTFASIPPIKAVATSSVFSSLKPPENNQAGIKALEYGVEPPMSPTFGQWNTIVSNALNPVWTGEKKAAEVLPPIAAEVTKLIQDGAKQLEGV